MKTITTRIIPASEFKGRRVKASAEGVKSLTKSCEETVLADNDEWLHISAARALCDKYNWDGKMIGGHLPNGDIVWVFDSQYSPRF